MSYKEFYCSTSMPKLPWKTCTAYFVAYFVVFTWGSSSKRSTRQTKHHGFSFICFFPRAQGGRDSQTPKQFAKFVPFLLYLYLKLLYESSESLKVFSNCVRKHREHEVTTVFIYSHLNTPINQWEHMQNILNILHDCINEHVTPENTNFCTQKCCTQL